MSFETVKGNLERLGYTVRTFSAAVEAAEYLNAAIDGKSVGFGGSVTLRDMGLYESLSQHNEVYWHWKGGEEARAKASSTQVYISSANGLAETGEIVNIDGTGNRLGATMYGHEKVYFVIGRNKLALTLEEAVWRARNIAAPLNAQRMQRKTPCAVKGDRCYNCSSPERICMALLILWGPCIGTDTEILLVDQDLGL